jgi:hypothetical protein
MKTAQRAVAVFTRASASNTREPQRLQPRHCHGELLSVERIGHRARTFAEARAWDAQQYAEMTPDERRAIAKALRDRYHGTNCPDVRDAVAGLRRRVKP